MAETDSPSSRRPGRITDARGRKVDQLDPVAAYLLRRREVIASERLRRIATEIDAAELRRRPLALLGAPLCVALWYAAFFGYFYFFSTWKGWDPVLIMFAIFYFLYPFVLVYRGFRKARRGRWTRICAIMLKHLYCPHCGYDIRGLPTSPDDGATVCPECGCAWRLDDPQAARGRGND